MNSLIMTRVKDETDYILNTDATVREIAVIFRISKSTVHKDLQERIKEIDKKKAKEVDKILKHHIEIRHIRGGESTKKKYSKQK